MRHSSGEIGASTTSTPTSPSSSWSRSSKTLPPVTLGRRTVEDPGDDRDLEKEFLLEIASAAKEKFAKLYDLCVSKVTLWRISKSSSGIMGWAFSEVSPDREDVYDGYHSDESSWASDNYNGGEPDPMSSSDDDKMTMVLLNSKSCPRMKWTSRRSRTHYQTLTPMMTLAELASRPQAKIGSDHSCFCTPQTLAKGYACSSDRCLFLALGSAYAAKCRLDMVADTRHGHPIKESPNVTPIGSDLDSPPVTDEAGAEQLHNHHVSGQKGSTAETRGDQEAEEKDVDES